MKKRLKFYLLIVTVVKLEKLPIATYDCNTKTKTNIQKRHLLNFAVVFKNIIHN